MIENKIYDDDMEIAEDIQEILIRHATGGNAKDTDEENYTRMRKFFLARNITKNNLPDFVIENRNLSSFWAFIQPKFYTYKERRNFIHTEFLKLFNTIEGIEVEKKTNKLSSVTNDNNLLHMHPAIREKCFSLYKSKEYAESVEKSFKVVRDKLRELTGYETGSEAFGKGKLHIKGASAKNVDEDFNQAVKFLTMAIDMFRNEKSHTSDSKIDDPIRAYQYLAMSSLAFSLLENSEIKN